MSETELMALAHYSQDILGYEEVALNGDSLTMKVPVGAVTAGRAAGTEICLKAGDVDSVSGQVSWLIEQIKEHCPTIYKLRLNKKNALFLPESWQVEPEAQLLLIWWNISIRAVNIREQFLLIPCKIMADLVSLLPPITPEEEEKLLPRLTVGAVSPLFTDKALVQVAQLSHEFLRNKLAPEVEVAMKEVEERRQQQLDQVATYYFLTSKRIQERVAANEAAQRWQLESLAQDKARLVGQLSQRYSAESVIINISPEVMVLCGYGK